MALSKYKDLRKYRLELRHQTNHAFDDMNAILLLTVDCTKLVKMIGKVKALIKESWSEACIGEVYPLFNFILVILQTLTIQNISVHIQKFDCQIYVVRALTLFGSACHQQKTALSSPHALH